MSIINPYYKVNPEDNIYLIREREFSTYIDIIKEMLAPTEDLGFVLTNFSLKNSRFSAGELNRTIKQKLSIKFQHTNASGIVTDIDLSMYVPKLIDHNYIVINGRKKIPQFQLFDLPIVTRGKFIKLRTNVATMMVIESKTQNDPFNVYISILGRKIPFSLLLFAYFGRVKLNEMFDLENITIDDASLFNKLMYDVKSIYDADDDEGTENYIKEVGRFYSKYDAKSKGEHLIYAINIMLKVDVISKRFFKTEGILEELIYAICHPDEYDDMNFQNKRVRLIEYIILGKIAKIIFDFCLSNRKVKTPKFSVNSTQILSECNVSDIVLPNFCINPIDEITKLSRISLVGPGGFNKDNTPEYLRDICPTMFGRICPVDTPDRDNCGILQNLLPNTKLDENLKFSDEILERQPVSAPVSMVPFLEHDDQTRLQMSSSQMRQAILLQRMEKPMIQSGCEGLYTPYTQFIKIAKKDGEVVYSDDYFIIVKYYDDTSDIFNVGFRKIYVGNLDIMKIYVKAGDKFKRGEILAESNFCEDGKIVIGKNLLTANMIYYGYNYEDGIVISDRLIKENIFTSIQYIDLSFNLPPNKVLLSLSEDSYKPLPDLLEVIDVDQPYAIMKEIPTTMTDFNNVFTERKELLAKKTVKITEINIYPNEWYDKIPEFDKWVLESIEKQKEKEENLKKIIYEHLPKDLATDFIRENNIDRYSSHGEKDKDGSYRIKSEKISGIHVEMYGFINRRIELGDKIANRHGNKGVIAKIIPHDKMPRLDDGRNVDICINPLGEISRMNFGQLFELHLSMSLCDLKKHLQVMLKKNIPQDDIKRYLIDYIKIIDNTESQWYSNQFIEQLPEEIDTQFIDELCLIQPPFESVTVDKLREAMEYTNTPDKFRLFEPAHLNEYIVNPVAVGYIYFFRMVHIAEERLAARGIASYTRKTLQPLAGRKNRGGQRCGEMETACLIAHEGLVNLNEFLTTKSDCIDTKNQLITNMIDSEMLNKKKDEEICFVPESVKLLDAYLKLLGIDHGG